MLDTNKHVTNTVFVNDCVLQNLQIYIFSRALFVIIVIISKPCYPVMMMNSYSNKCICNIDTAVGLCLSHVALKTHIPALIDRLILQLTDAVGAI